jgi:hypothetical protein
MLLNAILNPKEPISGDIKMFIDDYKKVWKDLNASKSIQSYHIIQLAILKAIEKYKDDPAVIAKSKNYIYHKMAQAFTPISRKVKLDNGRKEFDAVKNALYFIGPRYPHLFYRDLKNILSPEGVKLYGDIARNLNMDGFVEYYNREYVYIFVRQDISPEYQAVQSAHVTLRLGYTLKDMDKKRMENLYFTLVGVPGSKEIYELANEHQTAEKFFEPDFNNQITAIALMPVLARKRGKLMTYKKLVFTK